MELNKIHYKLQDLLNSLADAPVLPDYHQFCSEFQELLNLMTHHLKQEEKIIHNFATALQKHGVKMHQEINAGVLGVEMFDFEYDNEMEDFIQQYVKENYASISQ